MQLTRFDRWLKERFIYETQIFTLRIPEEGVPPGVKIDEVEQKKSGDYRHRITIKDNKIAEDVIQSLREDHIMHATHVVEANHWYNKHISPKGKSFTFMWILRFFTFCCMCSAGYGIYLLSQNEELVTTIKDTINELKGGM
ncbi:MAG: hypothetical protein AB8F34_06635 [Akkermansiaceae bacterium]